MIHEIYQHNFKTIKPDSIFTSTIIDPGMCEEIEKEIREMGDKQDYKTNVKAQMTEWNMEDKPGFVKLKEHILSITSFISEKYYNRPMKPEISDMWGMIYKKGDYAMVHDHWPALWSFVYYINAPKNASGLFFPEMGEQGGERKLEPGLMIFFEGHIKHSVRPSKFKGYRYVVSGNMSERQ